ncbi:helix-turn-helix domain-containing protein [Marinomonas sp.]|uniref:helix-turn-helix domain-containing protein n=1 Tax=Marinomonas sp. TaxID=1904862 RepID=UPI003BAD4F51
MESYQALYQPFQPTLTNVGQEQLGLSVQVHKPCLGLSDDVYAFVEVNTRFSTMYPIVPDGTNMLFFSICSESFGGTQSSILDIPLNAGGGPYFGIWFQPGKLRSFFDVDVSESTNQLTRMDFLENSVFLSLQENLYEKASFNDRVKYCEKMLIKHTQSISFPDKLKHALNILYREHGGISMAQLSSEVGWSHRHLNRQFLLHTGLTSKAFAQTIRINYFLKRCSQGGNSYLHHGLDLGFYDQSHILKTTAQHNVKLLSPISQQFMSNFYKPQP